MADTLPDLTLIVTNPNLSGRSLKMMALVRQPDGSFAVDPAYPDASLGDGQTTLIRIPLGARMVLSEAHEPPMEAVMANHPSVTGRPMAGQLTPAEEARRVALEATWPRTPVEEAELAALVARMGYGHPGSGAPGWPGQPEHGTATHPAPADYSPTGLSASEETRRKALSDMPSIERSASEATELADLQARVTS